MFYLDCLAERVAGKNKQAPGLKKRVIAGIWRYDPKVRLAFALPAKSENLCL
jgi:hypothetical protein